MKSSDPQDDIETLPAFLTTRPDFSPSDFGIKKGRGLRPLRRVKVLGLSAREDALVRRFIEMLGDRIQDRWLCVTDHDSGEHTQIDLVIVDAAAKALPATDAIRTLRIGDVGSLSDSFLPRPVRGDQLIWALSRVSDQLRKHHVEPPLLAYPAQAVFRLLRWPPSSLLISREHFAIATALSGREMTISQLSAQTGVSTLFCLGYLDTLLAAQIVESIRAPEFDYRVQVQESEFGGGSLWAVLSRIFNKLAVVLRGR